MTKSILAYTNKNPILVGFITVLLTVFFGMAIAFATGITTPTKVLAQVLPPCCATPPPAPAPVLPPPPPPPPAPAPAPTPEPTPSPVLPPCCDILEPAPAPVLPPPPPPPPAPNPEPAPTPVPEPVPPPVPPQPPPPPLPPPIIPPVIIIPPVVPPPAPACVLAATPRNNQVGEDRFTLSWTTTNAVSFSIDNGVGAVTPVAAGSVEVRDVRFNTTFVGTALSASGQRAVCTAIAFVNRVQPPPPQPPPPGGGGGGGGPNIILAAIPRADVQPLAFLYLSQIPYTGLELGPLGTVFYWFALISLALALAYFALFRVVPFIHRSAYAFGAHVLAVLNTAPELTPVFVGVGATAPAPAASRAAAEPELPEAPRDYSSYDGFKSFAHDGALSVEDIVKGLSQKSFSNAVEPAMKKKANVEPIYENVEPIVSDTILVEHATSTVDIVPASSRGFTIALIEGDREAVFSGLRQHVRGGGAPEQLITAAVCFLDDVYRARIDGTACDADIARMTARFSVPMLEKLVASLATAIDSSYSSGVIGAKLALTRALAILGA